MIVDYEEKTYENYFNSELEKNKIIYFPPGQVLEGDLGFDTSAFVPDKILWKRLNVLKRGKSCLKGTQLKNIATQLGKNVNKIPDMKANLFLQFKRPDYMTQENSKEWDSWNQKYFRYKISKNQHNLLTKIENSFQKLAIVLYSAPALKDINELFRSYRDNQIIKNSNFIKPSRLNGHHIVTYIRSGTNSKALSEPEEIEHINLIEEIKKDQITQHSSNDEFIISTKNKIRIILSENKIYQEELKYFDENYSFMEKYELLFSLAFLAYFKIITRILWIIILSR